MHESHKINFCKTLLLVLYMSLITGFFFNENSSGGSKIDFLYTLPFVKKISENFFLGVELLNKSSTIVHLPLHYIIVALFFKLFESTEILRIIFLNISILIPFIFYKSLGIIYKNKITILLIPALIFLSPYFRSSAIWPTSDNTALIFFSITIFFFLKIIKNINYNHIHCILFILFFFLSSLTRQYYIIFLVYFFYIFYKKNIFKKIKGKLFYVTIFIIIIGYVIFNNILKIKVTETFLTNNIFNNIYINLSILFFYFFPLFFLDIKNLNKFKKFFFQNKKFYFLSSLILFILYTKFNYSGLGGGFYYQLINNYLPKEIFLIISLLGFYVLYYFIYKNLNNLILILILFSIFNYNVVYQKYFDPLFLIIFFTLFKHSAIDSLIKTTSNFINFFYIFIYFFLYWLVNIVHHTN
jgi:hypothetical protein